MNNKHFTMVLNTRIELLTKTLTSKADEYARGDRLSNFKKIAAFRGITPEDACMGLVIKHIAALDDFIRDLDDSKMMPYDRWGEKLGDIIAYMVLLDALIIEREEYERKKIQDSEQYSGYTRNERGYYEIYQ